MTISLDDPVRLPGGLLVAAVSRTRVDGHAWRQGLAVSAEKTLVAVLIGASDKVRALDMRNRPMSEDEVDALCAGALSRFREWMIRPADPQTGSTGRSASRK